MGLIRAWIRIDRARPARAPLHARARARFRTAAPAMSRARHPRTPLLRRGATGPAQRARQSRRDVMIACAHR
eukprot:3701923-Pyramimonas_sp.AAC.1